MHFESILMIKSWVINVKASSKKRKFFIEQGKKANLNFKFFDAVTPSTLYMHDFISDPNIQRTKFARPLMETEVACALSHISFRLDFLTLLFFPIVSSPNFTGGLTAVIVAIFLCFE